MRRASRTPVALALAVVLSGAIARPAHGADPYPAMGPVVGGGSLIGLDVTVPLTPEVTLGVDEGFRPGLSIADFYPNADLGLTVGGELSREAPVRHGIFGSTGASAPTSFFDAWVAAGWHMVKYDARERRLFTLDLGPGAYLVRDLPPETALKLPVFVFVRFVFHVSLGPPGTR